MKNEETISIKFDLPDSSCEERFLRKREELANAINLLGQATGVAPDEIDLSDREVKSRLLSGDFSYVEPTLAEFLTNAYSVVQPNNYVELLKLIGMAHGTRTWRNNAEVLLTEGKCRLADIPATREEVYVMIREAMRDHKVYDTGFAYDVTNKACKGYYFDHGMDGCTMNKLKNLGLGDWFASYLLRVRYISAKSLSVLKLKYIILLTWYQTYYPTQYAEVIGDENIWEGGENNG